MIEAIVPVSDRIKGRRNFERLDILLRSVILFWRGRAPLRLHVIVPDSECEAALVFLTRYKIYPALDLNLLTESEISAELGAIDSGRGVMKQMLIKLAAFSFVKADFCLLLDSDLVACRPFSEHELVIGGRCLTEWKKPGHRHWWQESARVLGYELTIEDYNKQRIFVTPQILVRSIVTGLHAAIEKRYNTDWMTALTNEYSNKHPDIWTEYTLYDLFASRTDMLMTYHLAPDEMPQGSLHCMKQSIWSAEDHDHWNPDRALNGEDPGYFIVLQSIAWAKLDFNELRTRWNHAVRELHPAYIG